MNEHETKRVRRLEATLRETAYELNRKVQQNAMLLEVVRYATESDDLTLWQRIGYQRTAIREEIRSRLRYERWWRDTKRENDTLKTRIDELEARLADKE